MKVKHGKATNRPALPPFATKEMVFEATQNRYLKPSMPEIQALATKVAAPDFKVPSGTISLAPCAAQTLKELRTAKPDVPGLQRASSL
jgi:hypothetical protein